MSIEKMRKSMQKSGVYSEADINEICKLEEAYLAECEAIAEECVAEGYPSYGDNYELRCESARTYYDEQIADIDNKYN